MDKYIIPNLQNACRVLNFLGQSDQGVALPEISRELNIPRTTTLRILTTLCLENMTVKKEGRFFLGSALIPLGLRTLSALDVRTVGASILKDLADKTQATAHLAILSEGKSLLLDVRNSPFPMNATAPPGTLASLNSCSTGKVFIAYVIGDEIRKWFKDYEPEKRTPKTITTLKDLEKETARIRAQGYSLDDEEYFEGIRCLSAPIFDAHNAVLTSVGIMTTVSRLPKSQIEDFAQMVKNAAAQISKDLGGRTTA